MNTTIREKHLIYGAGLVFPTIKSNFYFNNFVFVAIRQQIIFYV